MTAQEIATLKQITRTDNDTEAITRAVRDFLRLNGLRELKAVSGKVDFEATWKVQEALELGETGFPQ